MSDTTHNTLVTILLIIAAVIIFVLLGRWFQTGSLNRYYTYQPASAIDVYRTRTIVPYYHQSSVTSYSRPSYSYVTVPETTRYQSSYYQSTYSYSCDGYGHCWTNQ